MLNYVVILRGMMLKRAILEGKRRGFARGDNRLDASNSK